MNITKKILLASSVIFIAIQFIQPRHNKSGQLRATDISNVISIPDTVMSLLRISCYDCHSNNTIYPWYSNIQPVSWLMAYHINRAKNELNFSEFGTYSSRRQISKLTGMANSIKDDIMPLKSYKLLHLSAQLSENEKSLIINWVRQSIDSIQTKK